MIQENLVYSYHTTLAKLNRQGMFSSAKILKNIAQSLECCNDIDIQKNDILIYHKSILDILLKDRTTKRNILWATAGYDGYGKCYSANCEIKISLITGKYKNIIQPRICKNLKNKRARTKDKAEVFTPSWVCNAQNNLIDEQWFCRKDIFNIQTEQSWITNYQKIEFKKQKGNTWKDYVISKRIEIACGEAPYLVSRYDTVTGKKIDIVDRVGLLDRKLRVINENTETLDAWMKWTVKAYKSIYGYEYQGDNLLLARENLLYTFIDNMKYKFNIFPTLNQLKKIANIISWNIWQMDGLTGTVPVKAMQEQLILGLFEDDKRQECLVKDWNTNTVIKYNSLLQKAKNE